jgi:hypothetical protein
MKRKYCGGGSSQCARYIVAKALGLAEVPGNLFPNDFFKISVILKKHNFAMLQHTIIMSEITLQERGVRFLNLSPQHSVLSPHLS